MRMKVLAVRPPPFADARVRLSPQAADRARLGVGPPSAARPGPADRTYPWLKPKRDQVHAGLEQVPGPGPAQIVGGGRLYPLESRLGIAVAAAAVVIMPLLA
jgi:hypothetical protein